MLQLYEYEGCPFCRLVRETLTELDIAVLILPCPRGGSRFRPLARAVGGREQFPLLVDDDTDTVLYESGEIIAYLRSRYGQRRPQGVVSPGWPPRLASTALCHAETPRRAMPAQPLELYGVDTSPGSRGVRETLCTLELAYVRHNAGEARHADEKPSGMRQRRCAHAPAEQRNCTATVAQTGAEQRACLIDPNTGICLYESADIDGYLHRTYGP
ncbi:glutathione S-transferase N-terminal domain-containing protein [Salinisphaera sp. T31B1]|uniref:glutathione S-transferase N-terminal domain-containing protein n=1 Tax=Salinisphaera sp. T31B1 TaxID=727963 RepID=UPI00333E6AE1